MRDYPSKVNIDILPYSVHNFFNHVYIKIKYEEDKISTATLNMERGLFTKRTEYTEVRHITDVSVKQNILERLLNYGDIILKDGSKSIENSNIVLKDIRSPQQFANIIITLKNKLGKRNLFVE